MELKQLIKQPNVQEKFENLLGKKSQGFISSVIQTVNNNKLLAKADPNTILSAAATAAALDLPINQNLGFAWIVPYGGKAQFQMGWRGFVQLALRTGQYKALNVIEVYENQFNSFNALTEELDADFNIKGVGKVVGYASFLALNNGFQKTTYWSREEVEKHAKKYSKSYSRTDSVWKTLFDSMAKKTVLKNMLSKWGILSIEMQDAIIKDQAVIDENNHYIDNDRTIDLEEFNQERETARLEEHLKKCKTQEDIRAIEDTLIAEESLTDDAQTLIENYKAKL